MSYRITANTDISTTHLHTYPKNKNISTMANETNWSANLDRKERERAKIALKEHKSTLPEQKMVRVDDKTTLIFPAAMSEAEIQKRVKRYHKYMKER